MAVLTMSARHGVAYANHSGEWPSILTITYCAGDEWAIVDNPATTDAAPWHKCYTAYAGWFGDLVQWLHELGYDTEDAEYPPCLVCGAYGPEGFPCWEPADYCPLT